MNKEQELLWRALEALHKTTGIAAKIVEVEGITHGFRWDARIEIEINRQVYKYIAEIKNVDRFAMIEQIKNQLATQTDQPLLVVQRITTGVAEKCREIGLQFIDTIGNVYLQRPGLFVFVKGQRPKEGEHFLLDQQNAQRAATPTNLRVVFALLCKPELLNAPYREINEVAGVALGAVGWVFTDLNIRNYTVGGKGERVLLEHQRLLQEWVTNFPIKLRQKLNPRRFHAPIPDWWKNINVTKYGAQWGGEVAAEKMTRYLKPQDLTIYFHKKNAQQNLAKMVVENRLRADPRGEIEVLDAFWNFEDEKDLPETVPPLLIYADLLATLDPRNIETAQMIYDKYLKNA
jgi:hypothetical protein